MIFSLMRPCQVDGVLHYDVDRGGEIRFDESAEPRVLLEVAERVAFDYLRPEGDLPKAFSAVVDKFKAYGNGKGPLPTVLDFQSKKAAQ